MRPLHFVVLLLVSLTLAACGAFGDGSLSDVRVENLLLTMPASGGQPARIQFDIGWDNSFRDELNWDAVWVFVKYRVPGEPWRHATLSPDSTDHSVSANNGVLARLLPTADRRGLFMERAENGFSSIAWEQVSLAWSIAADGVARTANAEVRVFALEMVYVPEASFLLGDGMSVQGRSAAQFEAGISGRPFEVTSEAELTLGGISESGLGNHGRAVSSATAQQYWDDFGVASAKTLPAEFPKGFAAFYAMKHETTQGEYAQLLNTLDGYQHQARNPAVAMQSGDAHRYAISNGPEFQVTPYNRAVNHMSWMDVAAFADWSALRPMTELEFEKLARGDRFPDAGEFAWGPEAPPAGKYFIENEGTPGEIILNQQVGGANAAFDGTIGAASSVSGPLRVGAFVPVATSRLEFGGSYYRATEVSGNVAEIIVTVGRPAGRRFSGRPGDGNLAPGGNAGGEEVEFWPGARRVAVGGYEVLNADGTGVRGGDWASALPRLAVSHREDVNKPADRRDMRWGGRLVRSAQ